MNRAPQQSPPVPRLTPGTVLDRRYQIESILAEGGFATVYQGRQLNINRPVAIKVLNPPEDPSARALIEEKFVIEAQSSALIRHPNIVTVFDYGLTEDSRQPFIVMELLPGRNLEHQLKVYGPLAPARALALLLPALEALGEAHEQKIVHRDLKPANLFLTNPDSGREVLKVLDFGVARVRAIHATSQTGDGQLLGSPRYLAPEYLRRHIVTPPLDVYQMGLILVEMLTGRPVVEGTTPYQLLTAHNTGALEIPRDLLQGPLGPVIIRALTMDHEARYQDAGQLRQALLQVAPGAVAPPRGPNVRLNEYLAAAPIAAPPPPPTRPLSPPGPSLVGAEAFDFDDSDDDPTLEADLAQIVQDARAFQAHLSQPIQATAAEPDTLRGALPPQLRPPAPDPPQESTDEWAGRSLREAASQPRPPRAMDVSINLPPTRPQPLPPLAPMSAQTTTIAPKPPPGFASPPGAPRPGFAPLPGGPEPLGRTPVWERHRTAIIVSIMLGGVFMFTSALMCLVGALYLGEPKPAAPVPTPEKVVEPPVEARPPEDGQAPSAVDEPPSEQPAPDSAAHAEIVVRFNTSPEGASIEDFGAVIGKTPHTLTFKPGDAPRRLKVTLEGHRDAQVDVGPGDAPTMTIKLSPEGASPGGKGNGVKPAGNKPAGGNSGVIDKW